MALINKTEGTTQTYGQLIILPAGKNLADKKIFVSPTPQKATPDILIKIGTNTAGNLNFDNLVEKDRVRIALLAASDIKDKSLTLVRRRYFYYQTKSNSCFSW